MDQTHFEEIASIATALSSLHQQRDSLNEKIATLQGQLRTLISQSNGDHHANGNGRFPVPAFLDRNRSLMDRIMLLLDSDPDYHFTAEAVGNWLPGTNINSIRSALARLAVAGEINRLEQGVYQSTIRSNR